MITVNLHKLPFPPILRKFAWASLVSLPVIAFVFKFTILYHRGVFQGGDWDYFAQVYEAARITILHYHQFPWWNPWAVGGDPLFANPQFGLVSLQMPLVLIFGTVTGLHLAVFLYFILGFWGMYLLLRRLGVSNKLIALLLSYIWVFSGFPAWHIGGGHLTFALYLLAPWLFLTVLNIEKRYGWLWFGLVASFMINSAPHYITVQALAIGGVLAVYRIVKHCLAAKDRRARLLRIARPYIYGSIVAIVLSAFKLVFTFQYLHEFPQARWDDAFVPLAMFTAGVSFRQSVLPQGMFSYLKFGWGEYADYFGLITLGLATYTAAQKFIHYTKTLVSDWLLLAAIILCALLCLGATTPFSPYSLLEHLPVFSDMRVPSRYVGWFAFGVILLLAKLPRKPVLYVLLILSTIDVFFANFQIINYPQARYTAPAPATHAFQEYAGFGTANDRSSSHKGNYRLLQATQNNYGDVYGYEPILGFMLEDHHNPTERCGINHGCSFVLTHNATVHYWSPNKILLTRTGSGPIDLNLNPGKYWKINGKRAFPYYKVTELDKPFIINDPAKNLTLSVSPL